MIKKPTSTSVSRVSAGDRVDKLSSQCAPSHGRNRSIRPLLVLAFAVGALPCLASDPPAEPSRFPPQIWTPSTALRPVLPLPLFPMRLTREQLDSSPISPTLYHALVATLNAQPIP